MLSRSQLFTPAAANANGFATAVTGATWTITTSSSSDYLAHLVTITNNTANSHATKTVIITGLDPDGNVQTETINLPAGSVAVTTTGYYYQLTSVVPSATIGADTMGIGWSAVAASHTLLLDVNQVAPALITAVITGTVNFSFQETASDPWSAPSKNAVWWAPTVFSAKTASCGGCIDQSAQAVRLLVNSVTAGATLNLALSQAGIMG